MVGVHMPSLGSWIPICGPRYLSAPVTHVHPSAFARLWDTHMLACCSLLHERICSHHPVHRKIRKGNRAHRHDPFWQNAAICHNTCQKTRRRLVTVCSSHAYAQRGIVHLPSIDKTRYMFDVSCNLCCIALCCSCPTFFVTASIPFRRCSLFLQQVASSLCAGHSNGIMCD